ncbi:Uncharacterised protein [Bacteroides caccae]|uniref:Uncharacterized protein n=1 Tax=Bacteroides caccae TaxID=47678 RepID=A0A174MFA4_9BACE|nr:Uncharacterised protein [Bacteroides caccae]
MCLFLQKAYKQIDNYYINQTAIGTTTNVDGKFTISNVRKSFFFKSIGYPLS